MVALQPSTYTRTPPAGAKGEKWIALQPSTHTHTACHTRTPPAGLARFLDCKKLTSLQVKQTKVTAAKIDELRKALPQCQIEWDGGIIEPTRPTD